MIHMTHPPKLDLKPVGRFAASATSLLTAVILALMLFSSAQAGAQTPYPVTDLATQPLDGSSQPRFLYPTEDLVFFIANDGYRGGELWRTDGTSKGTHLVADLCPGSCTHLIRFIGSVDRQLFFTYDNQLWVSDGSDAGTHRLHEACPGCTRFFGPGATLGDSIFFLATEDDGPRLWRSDGSMAGTIPVPVPAAPGQVDSYGTPFSNGSMVVFNTYNQEGLSLLWHLPLSSALSSAEPTLITTHCEDCYQGLRDLWDLGDGRILFTIALPGFGNELWVTDGTAEATRMVADLTPGLGSTSIRDVQVVSGVAYGRKADCEQNCLFRSDGTPEGTYLTPELYPVTDPPREIRKLTSAGGRLYAETEDHSTGYEELWMLREHESERLEKAISLETWGPVGDSLAFGIWSGTRSELKAVDDNPESLRILGISTVTAVTPFNDSLIYAALTPLPGSGDLGPRELELWITQGQASDARLLAEPFGEHPGDSDPSDLLVWPASPGGPSAVFRANLDDTHTSSLWSLSGDGAPTQLLEETPAPLQGVAGSTLFSFNDRPRDGVDTAVALRADGSRETLDLADERPVFIAAAGDRMFISTSQPGQRLWVTSGSNETTELLVDVQPEWDPTCQLSICPEEQQFPRSMTALGTRLLFNAFSDPEGPAELWVSDGTPSGTRVIYRFDMDPAQDIRAQDHGPAQLTTVGDRTYFTAFQQGFGTELWSTDGTTEGTGIVADHSPGNASSTFKQLSPWGDSVAVVESTPTGDRLLRVGPDGPAFISSLQPHADVLEMRASEQLLFLAIDTPSTGQELWVSDGTSAGTASFDLRPGPRGSGASRLTAVPGGIFFAADNGPDAQGQEFGLEPWLSDGHIENTRRIVDLFPGPTPSDPGPALLLTKPTVEPTAGPTVESRLYFAANHPELGRELFAVDIATGDVVCGPRDLCFHDARFKVTLTWQTTETSGAAQRVSAGPSSGLLWFFNPDNWEAMVKVLDGCATNDHYWVFAAVGSDVGYTLTVNDHLTGESRSYTNDIGVRSPAITDDQAFPCF